ncbi:RSP_7527 family protein [Dongia deserti]|uniref:RSP_7527 family protein n=1 Tax=Dongia deserti TaxID=2268030 RepID=UPI0038990431
MEQEHSLVRHGARLSTDQLDAYIAWAKAERARAIAAFFASLGTWLARGLRRRRGPAQVHSDANRHAAAR